MKTFKVALIPIFLLFLSTICWGAEKTVKLAWNYGSASYENISGFRLYRSTESNVYDTLMVEIDKASLSPEGTDPYTFSFETTMQVPDNELSTYYFVLSAFRQNGDIIESTYSNEISLSLDYLLPPPVVDFAANYDTINQIITFSWTYPREWTAKIEKWSLHTADTQTGPFSHFLDVPYNPDNSPPYSVMHSVSLPSIGTQVRYFTIVAHRGPNNNNTFSSDSNIVMVTLQADTPAAPFELQVTIKQE